MKYTATIVLVFTGSIVGVSQIEAGFELFAVPGQATTYGQAINDAGQVIGRSGAQSFLKEGATFTLFDAGGTGTTRASDINNSGSIVGNIISGIDSVGFLTVGGNSTHFSYPGADDTFADGINDANQIVGVFRFPGVTNNRGYLKEGNSYTTIIAPFPGAFATTAFGINNLGDIVGFFQVAGVPHGHGFIRSGNSYRQIDVPGAINGTRLYDINDSGHIVGEFYDASGIHSFLTDGTSYTTIAVPGATNTSARGINNTGQIVGYYNVGSSFVGGFVYTPDTVPEPTGLFLMCSAGLFVYSLAKCRQMRPSRS